MKNLSPFFFDILVLSAILGTPFLDIRHSWNMQPTVERPHERQPPQLAAVDVARDGRPRQHHVSVDGLAKEGGGTIGTSLRSGTHASDGAGAHARHLERLQRVGPVRAMIRSTDAAVHID